MYVLVIQISIYFGILLLFSFVVLLGCMLSKLHLKRNLLVLITYVPISYSWRSISRLRYKYWMIRMYAADLERLIIRYASPCSHDVTEFSFVTFLLKIHIFILRLTVHNARETIYMYHANEIRRRMESNSIQSCRFYKKSVSIARLVLVLIHTLLSSATLFFWGSLLSAWSCFFLFEMRKIWHQLHWNLNSTDTR